MGEGFIVRRGGGGQQTVKPIFNSLTSVGLTSLTLNITNDSNSIATLYYSVVQTEPGPTTPDTFDTEIAGQETKDITITGLTEGTTYTVYIKAIAIGEFPSDTVIVTDLTTGVPMQATGGTITTPTINGVQYKVHTFTNVGTSTFMVTDIGALGGEVDFLIVAGGGGGGARRAGGGGAGGVLTENLTLSNSGNFSIVVGNGGIRGIGLNQSIGSVQTATNGGNSTAFNLTAIGGGRGASSPNPLWSSLSGGSGGGGADGSSGSSGTTGQGNNGANSVSRLGGGGGGASQSGFTPPGNGIGGNGGNGLYVDWADAAGFGDNGYFGGGGGGGSDQTSSGSTGGLGGGGFGQHRFSPKTAAQINGTPNTGGGGGGGTTWDEVVYGGFGGSGIVIIRYAIQEVS